MVSQLFSTCVVTTAAGGLVQGGTVVIIEGDNIEPKYTAMTKCLFGPLPPPTPSYLLACTSIRLHACTHARQAAMAALRCRLKQLTTARMPRLWTMLKAVLQKAFLDPRRSDLTGLFF